MNKGKYDELCRLTKNEKVSAWYLKTEKVFKNQKVNNEDDFIKLVAFAYSWMPTIPEWNKNLDWKQCKVELEKLKKNDADALKKTLELITPSVNNSIVGSSKVLHFMFPETIPVIDSNVVIAWRFLFYPTGVRGKSNEDIAPLPSDFGAYGNDSDKKSHHIELYIKYSKNLAKWSHSLKGVSMRDIETKLYLLGKLESSKNKKID